VATVTLTRTDAWVFIAIGPGMWWASLRDVVTSLDYLNRDMPTELEFVKSVERLGRTGFVEVSGRRFKLTRSGRAALKDSSHLTGVITIMLELMNAWDGAVVPEANPTFHFELHGGEWDAAQHEYRDWLHNWMAKHSK
jgi:hypothetical protein